MLHEILDKTAERLDTELKDHPDVEADLRATIGHTYYDLHQLEKAEQMHRAALRLRQSYFGPDSPAAADSIIDLVSVLNTRADSRDLPEGERQARHALELREKQYGEQHAKVGEAIIMVGWNLFAQRRFADSEPLYRRGLALQRQLFGDDNPALVGTLNSLAFILGEDAKTLPEAETLNREALRIQAKALGPDHPDMVASYQTLSMVCRRQGKLPEAEEAIRQSIAIRRKLLGTENGAIPTLLSQLADTLADQKKFREAEENIREAIALQRKFHGTNHPHLATYLFPSLTRILYEEHKWAEAEAAARDAIELSHRVNVAADQRMHSLHWLAIILREQGKIADSEKPLRETIALCEQGMDKFPGAGDACAAARQELADVILAAGKYGEAEPLLLAAYENLKTSTGKSQIYNCRKAIENLIKLYQATSRQAELARWQAILANFKTGHPQP
jgi:tetratricopeptide (TPR) repeat protein